jgi:starch synthase (maltosyl-transferring)
VAPSIGFPESHDTERLMTSSGGLIAVQKQRYAFAAAFSAGLLMPIGYEFCFTRKLDVVGTLPEHWEKTGKDLSPFITRVNQLKEREPLLGCEGSWEVVSSLEQPTTVLCKRECKGSSAPPLVLLINKDWRQQQTLRLPDLSRLYPAAPRMLRVCREKSSPEKLPRASIALDPAEVVYVLPAT